MKILVFAAVLGTCLAKKFPLRSSYTSIHSTDEDLPNDLQVPPARFSFKPQEIEESSYSSLSSPANSVALPSPSAPSLISFTGASILHYIPDSEEVSGESYSALDVSPASSQSIFQQPQVTYSSPDRSSSKRSSTGFYDRFLSKKPLVPILQDNRLHEDDGSYSFSLHTGDGVKRQEKGVPIYTKEGPATAITGSYSYVLPNGQLFEVHYVADENGFQPQSNYIPVVPEFPHPIPAHALEQIERGRKEHEERARKDRLKKQQPTEFTYALPSRSSRASNIYVAPL